MLADVNKDLFGYQYATLDRHLGALYVWLSQTYSRGEVQLISSDPSAQPSIRMRILSDPRALSRMCNAVRQTVELSRPSEIANILSAPLDTVTPGMSTALVDGDATLSDYVLATVVDGQHATSTCRMGSADSPTAVVDNHCRVLGTDALRVVDASDRATTTS